MSSYERIAARLTDDQNVTCTITLIIGNGEGDVIVESWDISAPMYRHVRGHYESADVLTVMGREGFHERSFPNENLS